MAYLNLKAEMAKKGITFENVAQLLEIHRNSVSNKINGDSSFSIEQAEKIYNEFFRNQSYLICLNANNANLCSIK